MKAWAEVRFSTPGIADQTLQRMREVECCASHRCSRVTMKEQKND